MRKTVVRRWRWWAAGAASVAIAAAGRLAELALGKAAAFGYAVIVSLAANFAIDIARTPADNLLHAAGLLSPAGKAVEARAALPRAAAPSVAATGRPGPGSGGLY